MHAGYEDILEATAGKVPLWWDAHGVPRFRPHHPRLASNIYASEVVLLRIACQCCLHEQLVQMTYSAMDAVHERINYEWSLLRRGDKLDENKPAYSLANAVRDGTIHYGDPPHHEDRGEFCHAGCTMNVWDLKVEEFWVRETWEWIRVPELEIVLPDGKECTKCNTPCPHCSCSDGPQRSEEKP
jgi:hypothetical protein